MADVVYVCTISKVIFKLRERLAHLDLIQFFDLSGDAGIVQRFSIDDVGYVDDTAIPIFASAFRIVQDSARAAACAKDTFFEYSMVFNFGPGKSEALVQWRGKGAVKHKRQPQLN